MTYTHFGKQADVLKHLLLCELLRIEKPQVYIETNAACAQYTLERTPEQEYGIYHFLKKVGAAEKNVCPSVLNTITPKGRSADRPIISKRAKQCRQTATSAHPDWQ